MLYVYRRAASDSAADLATALGGKRWRDRQTPLSTKARAGDQVVCWGDPFTKAGVRTLNSAPLTSKFTDAEVLRAAGVSTIEVSRTRPVGRVVPAGPDPAMAAWAAAEELAEDFINEEITDPVLRSAPRLQGIDETIRAFSTLRTALALPAPVGINEAVNGEWIGRANNHVGGTDLLAGTGTDYYARRLQLASEVRIHSFLGRSIRAGVKVPRTDSEWLESGRQPHAWIRSWDGGWRISYDGETARQAQRDLAHSAIAALHLDFGAVDIGVGIDGSLVVLEVNRAPGLSDGTITRYVKAIQEWATPSAAARRAA